MSDASFQQTGMKYKVLVLGDWGVGKTSLVRHFVERKFYEDYIPNIGVNLLVKDLTIDFNGETVPIVLALWDIAGQEAFKPLLPMYHKGARGIIYVADLTRLRSFENLELWHEDAIKTLKKSVPAILLANKCDLDYWVDDAFLSEVAEKVGAFTYFKTSAKSGENVQTAFEDLAGHLLAKNAGVSW